MSNLYYSDKLYPLQDRVLLLLNSISIKHYLTGGTTISRFNYQHRYSDDLDFFMNRDSEFISELNRAIDKISSEFSSIKIVNREESFGRILIQENDVELKVEFINDVGFHSGDFNSNQLFYKLDNPINILSNKISALSRSAGKDLADILWISKNEKFNWEKIIGDAKLKDASVNELDVISSIKIFPIEKLMNDVKWIVQPDESELKENIQIILYDIVTAADNSLCKK